MKTRTTLAVASLVVLAGIGTAAGVASAQGDPAPPASSTPAPDHPKGQFVCANLEQIEKVQADHATALTDRLVLLASARSAAEEAGRTKAVARIDQRTAKVTERQQKVAARQQKLADFAAANCTTGG
jgi:hypothetical protein